MNNQRRVSHSIFLVFALFASLVSAQDAQNAQDAWIQPIEPQYIKMRDVIEQVRALEVFKPFDVDAPPHRNPPEVARASQSPIALAIRQEFYRLQNFLFGKDVFTLRLCDQCDLEPQMIEKLVIYVDLGFMEHVLGDPVKFDPNLLSLDLAHAFSHYILELYFKEFSQVSPLENTSRYKRDLEKNPVDETYRLKLNYHAEVEAFAAAILVMTGTIVPDNSPIVEMYREKRNGRRIDPYVQWDQDKRVNTLKWIRKHWPQQVKAAHGA